MSLKKLAKQASRSCGLPEATCKTLLEAGWGLTLDAKGPTRWEQGGALLNRAIVIEPGAITVHGASDPNEAGCLVAAGVMKVIP